MGNDHEIKEGEDRGAHQRVKENGFKRASLFLFNLIGKCGVTLELLWLFSRFRDPRVSWRSRY